MPGLGDDLLFQFDATLSTIAEFPEAYQEIHCHIRRALIRRFPYGVYYIIEEERIVVMAFFHVRRDPKYWQERE